MYRHVLDGLSDEFRVIAIDAPGHSKSELPASGPFHSLTRHAEFNERLMQALGLERPAIIGCSMGATLCWSWAPVNLTPTARSFQPKVLITRQQFRISFSTCCS